MRRSYTAHHACVSAPRTRQRTTSASAHQRLRQGPRAVPTSSSRSTQHRHVATQAAAPTSCGRRRRSSGRPGSGARKTHSVAVASTGATLRTPTTVYHRQVSKAVGVPPETPSRGVSRDHQHGQQSSSPTSCQRPAITAAPGSGGGTRRVGDCQEHDYGTVMVGRKTKQKLNKS